MKRTNSSAWRNALLSLCLLAFGLGNVAFFAALVWSRNDLIPIAAAMVPTSLTAAAAIFAIQSWSDARALSNDQKYRATLEAFVASTTQIDRIDFDVERPLRAQAVMWGSTELVQRLARRSLYLDRMVSQKVGEPEVGLSARDAAAPVSEITSVAHLGWLTAEVISTARLDLGLPYISAKTIYEGMWAEIGGESAADASKQSPDRPGGA